MPAYLLPFLLAWCLGAAPPDLSRGVVADVGMLVAGLGTAIVILWRDRRSSWRTLASGALLTLMIAWSGHEDVLKGVWAIFWWARGRYPRVQKRYGGTIGLTSVGMFGKGGGWVIPFDYHTLDVAVGGIAEKPGVVDGHIALREYLCMTLSFDHDVIDGAPAARFISRLRELIESGYGLREGKDAVHIGLKQAAPTR